MKQEEVDDSKNDEAKLQAVEPGVSLETAATANTTTSGVAVVSTGTTPEAAAKSPTTTPTTTLPHGLTYTLMVHKAIQDLKDRTGSSLPAIYKKLQTDYPQVDFGPQFRNRVQQALKNGVKAERFEKVKASFKISNKFKDNERKRKAAHSQKAKQLAAAKKKKQAAKNNNSNANSPMMTNNTWKDLQKKNELKLQELKNKISEEEYNKIKQDMKKKEMALKKKQEALKANAEREEKIKKRKFPMEDTKLHLEDKLLHVKPPPDVTSRPYIPYFWNLTVPLNHPSRVGKTSQMILQASKAEAMDTGTHGLVSDLLQVYHFFRGDVHFSQLQMNEHTTTAGRNSSNSNNDDSSIVPEFTLRNLVFATEQVINGNAKKSRLVPPLLVHLFVVCLQILCAPPSSFDENTMSKAEKHMHQDLYKYLYPALSSTSWADVLYHYLDAMERYYCTDATRNTKVVPPLNTDIHYLLRITDQAMVPMTPAKVSSLENNEEHAVPEGYMGYLGDTAGTLAKAYSKLAKMDPWMLTAEELMAALRALTDDILAMYPEIGADMSKREENMMELKRKKNKADAHLRKVRLAYEGPSKKTKKPQEENEEEKFKPTATKAQFEAAQRAQQKASDEYEKGIKKIVARTEPIGYDRNFNAVYCFRHDPEILYVEEVRAPTGASQHMPQELQVHRRSWHAIESTSLFDLFTSSLDIRGRREYDLYEELMGPPGSNQSLRRYLTDDIQEQKSIAGRKREREALQAKITAVLIRRDQGRKSERNAGAADLEIENLERELRSIERKIEQDEEPETRDYEELTGLDALRRFERQSRYSRRATRERKDSKESKKLPVLFCSKLVGQSIYKSNGVGHVWQLVNDLLEIEDLCQQLVPLDDTAADISRERWRSAVVDLANQWNSSAPLLIGSPEAKSSFHAETPVASNDDVNLETPRRNSMGSRGEDSASKRIRLETPKSGGGPSVNTIIDRLKKPLLQLEARIADITNVNMLERDSDMADENMSVTGDEEEEDKIKNHDLLWKKLIHRVRSTPSVRTGQIREGIVAAISEARRAHQPEVVGKLRAALLLFHSSAAGECKAAAVKVLGEYGGYQEEEEEEDDDDGFMIGDVETAKDEEVPSVLSADAAALAGSLNGTEDANRSDWIGSVESCRTLSRFSALFSSFYNKATDLLQSRLIEAEDLEEALVGWEKWAKYEEKAQGTIKAGRPPKPVIQPSEVWADVRLTQDFCMVRGDEFPWWPARKCIPKRAELVDQLERVGRSLVALVGEMGDLRVVRNEDMQPFTGKIVKDDRKYGAEVLGQLDDCVAMARRIKRGYDKATMESQKRVGSTKNAAK